MCGVCFWWVFFWGGGGDICHSLEIYLEKQVSPIFCLYRVLSQQRHFTEAGRYKPVTKEIRGMMGLQEYQDVAKGDQRVEELRQCGLNDDEIRLQLCKEGMAKGLDSCVSDWWFRTEYFILHSVNSTPNLT